MIGSIGSKKDWNHSDNVRRCSKKDAWKDVAHEDRGCRVSLFHNSWVTSKKSFKKIHADSPKASLKPSGCWTPAIPIHIRSRLKRLKVVQSNSNVTFVLFAERQLESLGNTACPTTPTTTACKICVRILN